MGPRSLGGRVWLPGPRGPCCAISLLKLLTTTTQEQTSPALREARREASNGPPAGQQQPGGREGTGPQTPRPRGPRKAGPPGHDRSDGRRVASSTGGWQHVRGGGRPGGRHRGRAPSRAVGFCERLAPEPRASLDPSRERSGRASETSTLPGNDWRRLPRVPRASVGAP